MRIRIPKDFPVRPLTAAGMHTAGDMATCGTCGLSWDDAIPTSYTPAPAARCPFEVFHKAPKSDAFKRPTWIMGRDQYGRTYHDLGEHPRKTLMERFGRKRASKMYFDKREGPPKHIGYVVGGHWVTLYKVEPWEREA